MVDEGLPTRDLSLTESIDLLKHLDQAAIEYLDVNETRLVAISGSAIFLIDAKDGTISNTQELTVRLWEPSQQDVEDAHRSPADEIEAFINRLAVPE